MKKVLFIFMLLSFLCCGTSVAENQFIREDRVWNYIIHSIGEVNYYLFKMKFDGTTEIDGKTYHNLKTYDCFGYNYDRETGQSTLVEEVESTSVFYLREEEGKVYVYYRGKGNSYFFVDVPEGYDEPSETLLYDFNLNPGESYRHLGVWGLAYEYKLTVKSIEDIDTPGGILKKYTLGREFTDEYLQGWEPDLSDITAVEGVGFNESATAVPFFSDAVRTGFWEGYGANELPIPEYSQLCLRDVTDLEGNLIYNNGMLSSVSDITFSEDNKSDTRIYDMMGREVKATQPGGVYIRAGRKFVGK